MIRLDCRPPRCHGILSLLVLLVCAGSALHGQATGGTITGVVRDEAGAALPGAAVTVTQPATGYSRSTATDGTGSFRLVVPIGAYRVEVALDGFASAEVEAVQVRVAQESSLEIGLRPAEFAEQITVTSDAPLIEESPVIGAVVSQTQLEKLPLNGRQFANLGTLAAGTSLGFNTDPTKPGQQVVALNGGIGRNVNYMVDGGDNMDDTIGGALQNYTLEAVAEFNIQTQEYKAEYGRSTGGVLSVVSKTGTNELRGSLFEFHRDESLNTRSETEKRTGADKADFTRDQFGGSVGGPIVQDRAHFFVAAERTERDQNVTTDTGGLFPEFDGTTQPVPFEDNLVTAKGTVNLSASNYLQVRYGYQKNEDKYAAVPNVTPDNYGTLTNEAESVLVGLNTVIGANSFNEALAQYSKFDNIITSDSTNPTIFFPSGVVTGQNINTPQGTHQEKWQFKDDFSFGRDLWGARHDFKAGIEYIDEPTLGGDFPSGLNGLFFAADDRRDSPITQITFFAGSFNFSTPNTQWRFYVQDDWKVRDNLTVNLGVRYEYTDVLELDQRSNAIWQTLSTQTRFNEPYLRDFQGGRGGVIDADDDDIAPRFGFAWDAKGDGRHVVRGGWGIYYDFPYSNATVLFPTAAVSSLFGVAYDHLNPDGIRNPDGSFFQPGDPLPANQVPGGDLAPAPNEVASPTLSTPQASQASLGYSWQATPWLGLAIDAVSIRYRDIPFRFRANPRDPTAPIDPETGLRPRRFPEFGNFRLWHGGGRADYDGVNLRIHARLSDRWELLGFYTYAEAEGNILAGADEFRLTDAGHQPDMGGPRADVSVDPLNPWCDACFGPLNTDARHRVTLSAVWQGPWGLSVSGIARYRSALPYTEHAGVDLDGDGFPLDLPPGVGHVNSFRGDSFSQVDVRVAKEFRFADRFGVEIIGEVFNLLDEENPAGFVGARNADNFRQPSFFAGDPGQNEQRVAQLGLRFEF